jgi:two-component system alkaline phosphatase synthesis response regulator PhoP
MAGNKALRILLVDDDKDLLELLEYNFEKEGFEVKSVAKVKNAIATAQTFQPDLIIMDIVMPDGNGIDLCREIRRQACFTHTIVFFLSACPEKRYMDATLEIGADDFIEKLRATAADQ